MKRNFASEGQEALHPVFTIATVTYNAYDTLQRTLDSVASQTYPFIEHLIIDGRSTDHTLSLIQRYVNNNTTVGHPHNIRLLCEPDGGLYDAMNKAISLATGDYIVFLNAGDKFPSPDTIEMLAKYSDAHHKDPFNPGILYGQTDLVDANGKFLRHRRLQPPSKLNWTDFRWGMLVCHQAFYVRCDIAKNILYDLRYRFSADFDWCIRIMRYIHKRRIRIVNTNLLLCHYLSEGMTTSNHKASLVERFRIMRQHYGLLSTLFCHLWFALRILLRR